MNVELHSWFAKLGTLFFSLCYVGLMDSGARAGFLLVK